MSRANQNRKKALKRWRNSHNNPEGWRIWNQYKWQLRNLPVSARKVPWL